MPRSGQGVYSLPAGSTFVPNTIIESSKVNAVNNDIAADLNVARPITAGGTGATTAAAARTALGFSADAANFGVKGADIASAATTDLSAATGDYVTITGTTTITALGTSPAGTRRFVRFSGILILTYNATSLILPTAANITTAAGDTAIFISEGSGNWRCVDYQRANGQTVNGSVQLQGYSSGLVTVTNSGTPNTNVDTSVGAAAADTSPYALVSLASTLTKNTNNSWAVGNNNGSLDTGAIANSTYYGWLIQRSDTGVVDVLTSLSSTAPTMPTNYDRKRLIFRFTRVAGINTVPVSIGQPEIQYSGTPPLFAPRAWVNFNGFNPATVRASGNITSVVRNGTGDYTVTFTTGMPDVNYTILVTVVDSGSAALLSHGLAGAFSKTTTSYRFGIRTAAGALVDADYIDLAVIK